MTPQLFIGITTWNSETFLGRALAAWKRRTAVPMRLAVWDNCSTDATSRIAREAGVELVVRAGSQADALDGLWHMAREPWVLLVHADVVALSEHWFDLCAARFTDPRCALVAPEDIGCGPYTRPFGAGMPESSFLFLHRRRMQRTARIFLRRRGRIVLPRRGLDFYADHVTHRLPARLAAAGLEWRAMEVHASDTLPAPRYGPYPEARVWSEELGRLRYGLGNFYSLDGVVTHYHNWYERIPKVAPVGAAPTISTDFPHAFLRDYTATFLADYAAGQLVMPPARARDREPVAL